MTNNIIQFPKTKMKTPPQSKQELDKELLDHKTSYVTDITDHYGSTIYNKLAMHGFNVDSDEFMKDYAYTIESLKSALLRNIGVDHVIQKTVDKDVTEYNVELDDEYIPGTEVTVSEMNEAEKESEDELI